MTNHIPDPEKMVCRHEPSEPVAAFYHVCKHCQAPIEAVGCNACEGTGRNMDPLSDGMWCKECDRSGIDRWEATP